MNALAQDQVVAELPPPPPPLSPITVRYLGALADAEQDERDPQLWRASCPACVLGLGQLLVREVGGRPISHCNRGCDEDAIEFALRQPAREPGEDDGVEAPASRLGLRSAVELLDKEIPPIEWLLEPYIERGSVVAVVAPPNLGKTLLAMWIMTQVILAGGRVAFIEEEGGERGFQKRLSRALRAAGATREQAANVSYSFKPRVSLVSPGDVTAMCDELVGFDLIIIDSLARCMPGVEENSSKEIGQVVASLDLLRTQTGAAVLTIHHTAKANWKPGQVPSLGDSRGSSALEAGVDTVISLAPVPVLDQREGVVNFDLWMTKQREEAKPQGHRFSIAMTGPEALVQVDVPGQAEMTRYEADLRAKIWAAIPDSKEAAKSKNGVYEQSGGNKTHALRVIDEMIREGHIGISNGRLYRADRQVQNGL